jgi:hypothetical protein
MTGLVFVVVVGGGGTTKATVSQDDFIQKE